MRRNIARRSETFGYDQGPDQWWAHDALRLVFSAPRVFTPLADSWAQRYRGVHDALHRLTDAGWCHWQDPVIVNVRTGQVTDQAGRAVTRYVATKRGRALTAAARDDIRVISDTFPKLTDGNAGKVFTLLDAACLDRTHARWGLSAAHLGDLSGLPGRSARWWLNHLVAEGHIRILPDKAPDQREVIPGHWRVTRDLCRQLRDVLEETPGAPVHLRVEFRLNRNKFLDPIDPARLGISGATDYDHDIAAQHVISQLLRSPQAETGGVFAIEPRYMLTIAPGRSPQEFLTPGHGRSDRRDPRWIPYQPDGELRARRDGRVERLIVEFERFQSRRDAWSHLERCWGWLHQHAVAGEHAALLFVVDSPGRVRPYVELIEAYADYLLDHPERGVRQHVTLAVTHRDALTVAVDPLAWTVWNRLDVPASADTDGAPVLHDVDHSPYDEYFARST